MFVVNRLGHFFEVNTATMTVDKGKFDGCMFFDTEDQMVEHLCGVHNLDADEVRGYAYYLTFRDGQTLLIDDRGMAEVVEDQPEAALSEFAL